MNKKGSLVLTFIIAALAVILLAYLLVPQVKQTINTATNSEEYVKGVGTTNLTLAYYPLVSSSLVVENCTLNPAGNYTILDAARGLINFNNTAAATYTISYSFQGGNYLTASTERALMALVVLAGLIGLVVWIFKAFGLFE